MNDLLELQEQAITATFPVTTAPVPTSVLSDSYTIAFNGLATQVITGYTNTGYTITGWSPTQDDVRAREIESRLNALGSDAIGIAKSLANQDITGVVAHASECAVARWLKRNFEGYGAVSVGGHTISLHCTDGTRIEVGTPRAVRDFICMFDSGAFPSLAERRPHPTTMQTLYKEGGFTHAVVPSPLPQFVPSL